MRAYVQLLAHISNIVWVFCNYILIRDGVPKLPQPNNTPKSNENSSFML